MINIPNNTRSQSFGSFQAPKAVLNKPAQSTPQQARKMVQNINDFTGAANDKFLGGTIKGAVNTFNTISSGFNADEAEKKTNAFTKQTFGLDKDGRGSSLNRYQGGKSFTTPEQYQKQFNQSKASQLGEAIGTTQGVVTDVASLALPGMAAEKALRGTKALQALSKTSKGRVGAQLLGGAGGSLTATGIGAVQDIAKGNQDQAAQNALIGTAIDASLPVAGKLIGRGYRALQGARSGADASEIATEVLEAGADLASTARSPQTRGKVVARSSSPQQAAAAGQKVTEQAGRVKREKLDRLRSEIPANQLYQGNDDLPRLLPIAPNMGKVRVSSAPTTAASDTLPQGRLARFLNTNDATQQAIDSANIESFLPNTVRVSSTPEATIDEVGRRVQANARRNEVRDAPDLQQTATADNYLQGDRNFPQEIAEASNRQKQRYGKVTLREKVNETFNQYNAGAKIDEAFGRYSGTPQRDIPKNQSMEALAERTRNSGQEAQQYLRDSNIGPVVQKYGVKNPESESFNTYRTFMRDLEQRADGRPALYRNYSDDDISRFINEYEVANPNARTDLQAIVRDIERVQDEAVRRGVVDSATVDAARLKKDGSRYEFYTPVSRATPENLERATINANGVGSIGNQSIIQDLKGSDIPLDPSFDSVTDYVNTAYRQMAKAETSQVFADRVRQGLVPGARFTDTSENAAARKAMRDQQQATGQPKDMNNYAELQADPTTGLQVISGRQNGATFKIEVPPEQARFLQGLGDEQLNTLFKTAKAIQTPFRTVLTGALNAPFQVLSAAYNAVISPVVSPQGFRVFGPRAVGEAFKSLNSTDDFQRALRANGAQGFTGNLETTQTIKTAEALAAERDLASKVKFNATNPGVAWRKLDVLGAKIEGAQRTGIAKAAYDARLRKNGSAEEAIADAVYAYNNVLPNFGRNSSVVRQADSLLMYTGASLSGTRSLLTALKRDPVGASARLALVTSPLIALAAYSNQQETSQAFYEDMVNSKKEYLLDNNAIIVMPGASKDPQTGEWSGVVKFPLPPELRPINHAIWSQVRANAEESGVPVADYARALFDTVTGSARTLANPAVDLVYGLTTGVDRSTGREVVPADMQRLPKDQQQFSTTSQVAKDLGKALNVSPLQVDYVLSKSGFPGQIAKGIGAEGGPLQAAGESIANRFTNTYGEKDSTKFFKHVDKIADGIASNDDLKTFQALHASDDNAGLLDTPEKAVIYLNRPEVYAAEKKLDQFNRDQGKPGNPLFDLSPEERSVVLSLQANKGINPGDKAMVDVIEKQQPWIKDYYNKQSEFFDKLNATATKNSDGKRVDRDGNVKVSGAQNALGIAQPEATDAISQKFKVAETITDSKQKALFYQNNPDVTEYLSANEEYNRAKRAYLGLPQLDRFPGNPELQAVEKQYFALPEKSAERKAFMKNNPALSDYWLAKNLYQLNEAGARARYEGENLDEDAVKDIQAISKSLAASSGYGRSGSGNSLIIKPSDYDGVINIDQAPAGKITATRSDKKVTVKPRQKRTAKVTSTKVKS